MKTKVRLIILLLIVVGVALWAWRHDFWRAKPESNVLVLSGNIEAHESVLSFKTVQSRIVELPVHEGQWVKQGTVLAVVDSADYQQQLAIAQANLATLKRQLEAAQQNYQTAGRTLQVDQAEVNQRRLDLERARDLRGRNFVSQAALDQAETGFTQATAVLERDRSQQAASARSVDVARANVKNGEEAVNLARIVVGYTTLVAPFDGVVTVRQAELGEVVVPGTPVVTLADLDHVWLRAYLNEPDLGRIHLGQEVAITSDSFPGKRYQGRISFIAEKAEFTPKSVETHAERVNLVYRVKIEVANTHRELAVGMPADARIELGSVHARSSVSSRP